ncbi:MAG: phosphatidylserine decarboxylase [Rhodospirillales bacterium]
MLKTVLVPINRAGWPFIGLFAAAALVLTAIAQPLGLIGAVLTLWCLYFFRDPDRVTPVRPGLIVSPADGVVQSIGPAPAPPELAMAAAPLTRVAVFMNVFDVHVNRIPVDGTVQRLAYTPGRFVNASLDKASEHNERQGIVIATADGIAIAVVQIAGLIARRIKCDLVDGQPVRAGERFGMIRFGSRLDVYLPEGVAPLVAVGQRTIAGETVLADLRGGEPARAAERR